MSNNNTQHTTLLMHIVLETCKVVKLDLSLVYILVIASLECALRAIEILQIEKAMSIDNKISFYTYISSYKLAVKFLKYLYILEVHIRRLFFKIR